MKFYLSFYKRWNWNWTGLLKVILSHNSQPKKLRIEKTHEVNAKS